MSLRKEKERLLTSEQKYQKSTARMREIRNNTADGSSAALFTQMTEETTKNRYLFTEKLPKDILNKKHHIKTVQEVLETMRSYWSRIDYILRVCHPIGHT
jgi:predicted nucleotidyltransferase